jgi:hypothetical protein
MLTTMAVAGLLAGTASPALASGGKANGGGATSTGADSCAGPDPRAGADAASPEAADHSAVRDLPERDGAGGLLPHVRGRVERRRLHGHDPQPIAPNQGWAMVADDDFAPYDASYCITNTATDADTGVQLDRATLSATTPPAR